MALQKGFEYLQKKKKKKRDVNTFEVVFFSWQSLQLKTAAFSCFCDLPRHSPVCTYTVSESSSAPLCAFWGRRVCADVVYFGGRWEWKWSADIRWGVSWNPSILGFYNREIQLAEGLGSKSRLKKMYIFSFIKIPPIERTFCWGGYLPRTSNSVCSFYPFYF